MQREDDTKMYSKHQSLVHNDNKHETDDWEIIFHVYILSIFTLLVDPSILQLVDKWKANLTNVSYTMFVGEVMENLVNDCHMVQCDIGSIVADSFVYYVSQR